MKLLKKNKGKFKLFEPLKTITITPAQQREYERQIKESSRRNGRKINKQSALEKMRSFFQKDSSDTYTRKIPFKK